MLATTMQFQFAMDDSDDVGINFTVRFAVQQD
jgi:hypothetical protein